MTIGESQSKQKIFKAIRHFDQGSLKKNATSFLNALGYGSDIGSGLNALGYGSDIGSGLELSGKDDFLEQFDPLEKLNSENALFDQWLSVEVLFQSTDEDINQSEKLGFVFESSEKAIDNKIIQSFLFTAKKDILPVRRGLLLQMKAWYDQQLPS